jgi:hypothetical protein
MVQQAVLVHLEWLQDQEHSPGEVAPVLQPGVR